MLSHSVINASYLPIHRSVHSLFHVFPLPIFHLKSAILPSTLIIISVQRGALYDLDSTGTGESKQYDPSGPSDPRDSPSSAGPRQYPSTVTPVYVPGSSVDDEGGGLVTSPYFACVLFASFLSLTMRTKCLTAFHPTRCALITILSYFQFIETLFIVGVSKSQHCPSAGIAVAYDHFDSFLRHTALFRSSSGTTRFLNHHCYTVSQPPLLHDFSTTTARLRG